MNLLNVWREWEIGSPPYILKGDDVLLSRAGADSRIAVYPSWESYTQRDEFGRPGDIRLHLNLIPIPFVGDLARARIVVLLLNPGLEPDDYFAEFTVPGFRDRLLDNLRQEFKNPRYPFVYLDPALSWHSGYRWWHGKFQGLIAAEISKAESGQMNNVIAWFRKHYGGTKVKNLMIIPTKTIGHAAGFNEPVEIVRNANLRTGMLSGQESLPKQDCAA